jgi:exopolyphosphatase / guanosine-5'-triphosphate,3'-diphosphate pyrophosphatase
LSRRAPRVPDVLAAVDLGSNSFHLVVARYTDGQLIVLDRLREPVRIAEGVDEQGRLDRDVAARALECLRRFGQRLEDLHARSVRVVGTSALRQTRNRQPFLDKAREALGHRIEIISGREEARLIYSGVAQTLPDSPDNRLVVDIGGGSTEMIIGRGAEPLELESLKLGCVMMSKRYFADGRISGKRFARARLAAQQELEPVQEAYLKRGWKQAAGSSGTVRSIFEVQKALDPKATGITADGMEAIIGALISAGSIAAIALEGVTEDRRAVFPGGVAILAEIFAQLGIENMRWAEGAMREGLLYDMVGRYTHEDARERTVRSMQQRYHVDTEQAARVEQTALLLLEQVQESWQLQDPLAELALTWSCRLHEIGLDVAHSGYHRHGAYLLENADMPGFAREEQQLLARLVGAHRRKLALETMSDLEPPWDMRAMYLALILRIAVLLHRNRSAEPLPAVTLTGRPKTLELRFKVRTFRDHPLTAADLNVEIDYLREAGLRLRVFTS